MALSFLSSWTLLSSSMAVAISAVSIVFFSALSAISPAVSNTWKPDLMSPSLPMVLAIIARDVWHGVEFEGAFRARSLRICVTSSVA